MPFQVYVDDSGGKGQPPVMVYAGLIATAERWAEFTDEWQAELDARPKINYFKMHHAAGLKKEFNNWRHEDRDAKVRALARIINKFCSAQIYSAAALYDYAKIAKAEGALKPLSEPFFFPFYALLLGACDHLWGQGARESVEFIFDEHVIFAPRWTQWYPIVREVVKDGSPERYPLLPPSLIFKSDMESLPLQAADLIAWNTRRKLSGQPNPFEWLAEELQNVEVSANSQNLTGEEMQSVVERAREAGVSREQVERYKDLLEGGS